MSKNNHCYGRDSYEYGDDTFGPTGYEDEYLRDVSFDNDNSDDESEAEESKAEAEESEAEESEAEEEDKGVSTVSLEQDDSDIGPPSKNSTTQMDLGLSATEAFARQKMRAVAGKPKDLPLKSAIKFDWGEVPSSMSKPGGRKADPHKKCRETVEKVESKAIKQLELLSKKLYERDDQWSRQATLLQEALTATHAITTEQCKAGNKLITEKKKLNDLLEKQHFHR